MGAGGAALEPGTMPSPSAMPEPQPLVPMGPIRPAPVRPQPDAPEGDDGLSAGVSVAASDLLAGHVCVDELGHGWVRPWRFLPGQRRALESCMAWYPGIFRQMAACTAGVRLEFETDSTSVRVELRVDDEPRATRNVLVNVDGPDAELPHDGISADVDGAHLAARLPAAGEPGVTFDLVSSQPALADLMPLPGMGPAHRITVWLPCLRGCEVGMVTGDGSYLRRIDNRTPRLLVLGDSVAQGFCADDPALAWPSVVAGKLGMPLLNQSVGAQVYQPSALAGLASQNVPESPFGLVIVALGGNYRYGRCNPAVVGREIAEFLSLVDDAAPDAPLVVMPPYVKGREAVRGSCYEEVPQLVAQAAERVRARRARRHAAPLLLLDAPDVPAKQLADEDGHPTAKGEAHIARHVLAGIKKLDCRCLRETGSHGRCGACRR